MKKAQLTIISIALISLLLISIVVTILTHYYEVHNIGSLEVKVVTAAESIESIRSDLKRILALLLANASRMYAYSPNEHNLTKFRAYSLVNLEKWVRAIAVKYDAIVKLNYPSYVYTFQGVNYLIPENYIFKLYWYRRRAVSIGYIEANVSIPSKGIYNVSMKAFVSLAVHIVDVVNVQRDNVTWIVFRILSDGIPVSDITGIDVTILYPSPDKYGYWVECEIVKREYLGLGYWNITVKPYVPTVWGVIPLRVYVEDFRGIIVSPLTYSAIILQIDKRTPDKVYYYDPSRGKYVAIDRKNTPDEIYTVELDWKWTLHFLLNEIPLTTEPPPPIPPIPVKQMRLYLSKDLVNWILRPVQFELWKKIKWHGHEINVPIAPADPAYWFNQNVWMVFQVSFPTKDDKFRYVKVTWESDCDADLIEWPTSLIYVRDLPNVKDVECQTFRIEFIDIEHRVMRDYGYDYHGVAALGIREPGGLHSLAYGPTNIHSFGIWDSSLGAWRPYGNWTIFAKYSGVYSGKILPVRIFAVLNSTKVGNVYTGATSSKYYDTIAIVYIINGTKYFATLVHIYWKRTRNDEGFWMFASMGGGKPVRYMYLKNKEGGKFNVSKVYTYGYSTECGSYDHPECMYPNFFATHWGNEIGRAVFLSHSAVDALYTVGSDPRFAITYWAPGGKLQKSLEYEFTPTWKWTTVYEGTYYSYWFVFYRYSATDDYDQWKKAYKYSPMFLENYAPGIQVISVESD